MQFIDKAAITIKAGDGGNGCVAFHREKYVPRGGPSGGDGGRGGDVLFEADARMTSLIDFKYKRHYSAPRGEDGKAEMMSGKDGENLIIRVPVGTVVRERESGAVIADMREDKQQRKILSGGRGGKGNARFATPTRQAPRFAQPGQRVLPYEVELELKTIADVGLIGLPNVGKSTLLSVLTKARPKIANYHFTTLSPNLGVVQRYQRHFVLADIPGLIEGAATGAGLGHDFLRHIERTRMLLHVVDISGHEGRDPLADYETINAELRAYSEKLSSLPQLVVANKMDIPGAEENLAAFEAALAKTGVRVFPLSAVTHAGLDKLLQATIEMLDTLPPIQTYEEEEITIRPLYAPGFEVKKDGDGAFSVFGGDVDKLLDSTDPNDEASMRRFQQQLIKMGIIDALKNAGAKEGDTVLMGDWDFDFLP